MPKARAHIDITPIIYMANGDRIQLGTVRYEVEAENLDVARMPAGVPYYVRSQPTGIVPTNWVRMEFEIRTTPIDGIVQPTFIPVVK